MKAANRSNNAIYREYKKVRIQFSRVNSSDELLIRDYIEEITPSYSKFFDLKHRVAEALNPNPKNRKGQRFEAKNVGIRLITNATRTLPARNIFVEVVDISHGGICVAVPKDIMLAVGGIITADLSFIDAEIVVTGVVLGLKTAKLPTKLRSAS